MDTRIDDLPIMAERDSEIDAAHFNKIRLGLLRLGTPHRIRLEGLRSLDMLLDTDEWVIVDREMDDLPVIAWRQFGTSERDAINAPVNCHILYFHQYANVVKDKALDFIADYMDEHVHETSAHAEPATVSDIPVREE